MKIVSVLRTGPEYQGKHAQFLHRQLKQFGPSVCLTDLPQIKGVDTLRLQHDPMGWWAKMELFNPDGPLANDDLFYLDIDTKIVGDIRPLLELVEGSHKMVMLSDFYHPQYAASGVMYIPKRIKERVWKYWIDRADWFVVRAKRPGRVGDQGVIQEAVPDALRWDQIAPGKIVSYKKHVIGPGDPHWARGLSVGNGTVPADASIICYHGKPRPWSLK